MMKTGNSPYSTTFAPFSRARFKAARAPARIRGGRGRQPPGPRWPRPPDMGRRHRLAAMADDPKRPAAASPRSLSGLLPFIRPYRGRVALALVFLVLAALSTLAFPVALKVLIDQGLVAADPGERLMALRGHFLTLFGVAAALGAFSAARFYMVSWLGERITADLRNAVYAHVLRQSPEFFESTKTGEVLSRLTTDTTLVQTVVGSSLSMGLRNTVMGIGALVALIVTNPWVMTQVLGVLVLVCLLYTSDAADE